MVSPTLPGVAAVNAASRGGSAGEEADWDEAGRHSLRPPAGGGEPPSAPSFLVQHLHTPLAASLARRQAADQKLTRKKMPTTCGEVSAAPLLGTASSGHASRLAQVATPAPPPASGASPLVKTVMSSPASVDTNATESSRSSSGAAPAPARKTAGAAGAGGCRVNVRVVVRCRPMTAAEQRESSSVVDIYTERNEVAVRLRGGGPPGFAGKAQQSLSGAGGGSGNRARLQSSAGAGGSNSSKVFRFDGVCPVSTSQQQLFEQHAQPLVDEVLQGFNCTIFAYGQTGTGKTVTVEGAPGAGGRSVYDTDDDIAAQADCGLVGRSVRRIFSTLRSERAAKDYTVTCSFLEIYNEELVDLFSILPASSSSAFASGGGSCPSSQSSLPGSDSNDSQLSGSQGSGASSRLRIYEDNSSSSAAEPAASGAGAASGGVPRGPQQARGVVRVEGLEEKEVKSEEEVFALLRAAAPRRSFAASSANARSSRSHTIFSVSVSIRESASAVAEEDGELEGATPVTGRRRAGAGFTGPRAGASVEEEVVRVGKLNLVDLAGSENIYKSWGTTAEEKRRREALTINKSLLTLGRCINALVDNASYVPYRDSKLTRLLQDSLGGCTKTCLIATISPAGNVVEETINTLDYAYRAKSIQNLPVKTLRHSKSLLLSSLLSENQQLKLLLASQRERDGVFLPLPLYTQQEERLQSQQEQLLAQDTQIRCLEDRLQQQESQLKAFEEMEARLRVALDEQSSLQQRAAQLAAELAAANETGKDLQTQVQRLEGREEFVATQMTQELQKQRAAAAAASRTLNSAIHDLLSLFSHQKEVLARSQARGRDISTCFAQEVDAACSKLAEEQTVLHRRLEASLKSLRSHEDARASAALKAAELLQGRFEAQQSLEDSERQQRVETLAKWHQRTEAHRAQATEGLANLESELERQRERGKVRLTDVGQKARAALQRLQCRLREQADAACMQLEQKAAEETKHREHVRHMVAGLAEKEISHAGTTSRTLERLESELDTWKDEQERQVEEATAALLSALQRQIRQLADQHQEALSRHAQTLQRQLKALRDEQKAQQHTLKALGEELAVAADDGGATVTALASAARSGLNALVASAMQATAGGQEALKAHELATAAALEQDGRASQSHIATVKDCFSAHHRALCTSLEEASAHERKIAAAKAEADRAACEANRERQKEEERLRGLARDMLTDAHGAAEAAEAHRQGALRKQQQRAGEFVKTVRKELRTPCDGRCPVPPGEPLVPSQKAGGKPVACASCFAEATVRRWTEAQAQLAASAAETTDSEGDFCRLADLRRRFLDLETWQPAQSPDGACPSPAAATGTEKCATPPSSLPTAARACWQTDTDTPLLRLDGVLHAEPSGLCVSISAASSALSDRPSSAASRVEVSSGQQSLSTSRGAASPSAANATPGSATPWGHDASQPGEKSLSEWEVDRVSCSAEAVGGEAEEATEEEDAEYALPPCQQTACGPKPETPSQWHLKAAKRSSSFPQRSLGKDLARPRVGKAPGAPGFGRPSPRTAVNADGKKSISLAVRMGGEADAARPRGVSRGAVLHRPHAQLSPLKNEMREGLPGVPAQSRSGGSKRGLQKMHAGMRPGAARGAAPVGLRSGRNDGSSARPELGRQDENTKSGNAGAAPREETERQRQSLRRRRSSDGAFLELESEKKKPNTDVTSPRAGLPAVCAS
ncbi:kinesin motor domain-containing protein [Besnoitia besnoiti]|uniref:Kinesin motor domain-containing protein n=1 Tax=Besnoitia besnoiti TaxID=94643 RepID=A0A2A9MAB5_BESBE|nr:kinesin motor domain-containing protein [Besnoitia besnoiti]PFH35408.1 kinesin motor domain-containing protein [Besnoitia besnoiti]